MASNKEGHRHKSALVKKDFNQLLPKGFQAVITPQEARRERNAVYKDRYHTFSSAVERARDINALAEANSADRSKVTLQLSLQRQSALDRVIDPLEAFRQRVGLIARRDQSMNLLFNSIDPEETLSRLTLVLEKRGVMVETMEDLNNHYPHITQTELGLLALTDLIPEFFLEYGRPFNHPVENPENDPREVPFIVAANANGLIMGLETVDPNRDWGGYAQLGVTEAPGTLEHVPFGRSREIITELLSLSITNYRLHERVWNSADSALIDGIGRLDRLAIMRATGTADSRPISQLISSLSANQRRIFEKEQKAINNLIATSLVVDVQNGNILHPSEIIKLLGLLDQLPVGWLTDNRPFQGFFTPFGPGVLFMDGEGEPQQYRPYSPYYLRQSLQGVYYESVSSERENKTMALIFNQLSSHAHALAMRSIDESCDDPSLLEGVVADLKLRFNINLHIKPLMNFVTDQNWIDAYGNKGKKSVQEIGIKVGYYEAKQILNTLQLVPREMLARVRDIVKINSGHFPLEEILNGITKLADFNKDGGVLRIYQDGEFPFYGLSEAGRALYSYVLLHEVAHGVWEDLTTEEIAAWKDISWSPAGSVPQDFLTFYSRTIDSEEDFTEHFASFVLHGEEFRHATVDNEALRRKYEVMKNVFRRIGGGDREYPQISSFTLRQIHGELEQEIKKRSFREAVEIEKRKMVEEDVAVRSEVRRVAKSNDNAAQVDVLDDDDVVTSDDEVEESVAETVDRETYLSFKRAGINRIIDYISDRVDEDGAIRRARLIYQLAESGDIEAALSAAGELVEDDDVLGELKGDLEEISQDIRSDNIRYKVDGN